MAYRFRFLHALNAALLLALAFSAAPARADVSEFNECSSWMSAPYSVLIRKEPQGWLPVDVIRRTETYYDNSVRSLFKNPEQAEQNGPLHGRNCTVNAVYWGTQTLQFRLKTVNYFGSASSPTGGVAGHLAILMRGQINRVNYQPGGTQTGRGLAIFRTSQGGVTMENFSGSAGVAPLPNGQLVLQDGRWYSVLMHVHYHGIGYSIRDEAADVTISGYKEDYGPYAFGQGYGFGVLCNDANGNCASVARFEVLIQDIQTNWFL
jgi:hypothetical protein